MLTLLLPACSGDRKDAVWWDNEKQIVELESKMQLARYRAGMLSPVATPILELEQHNISQLIADIESLSNAKAALSFEIAGLENSWDEFREETLARRRAATTGMVFETFETATGRKYSDVTVSRIDDGGVSLRHKAGTARLRFEDLDSIRQEFFGLDGELSVIAHKAEAQKRTAYNRWISDGMMAAKAEEAKVAKSRKEDEILKTAARALAVSNRTRTSSPLSASIGGLGDTRTIYSSRRYSYYGSYGRSRNRYYYNNYNSTPSYTPAWNGNTTTYRPPIIVSPVTPAAPPTQCPTNPFNP